MDQAAALIRDLKRSHAASDSGTGRDHDPYSFTMLMAGGGVQGELAYGATDEFGVEAKRNRVSIHDLHPAVQNLLGLDESPPQQTRAGESGWVYTEEKLTLEPSDYPAGQRCRGMFILPRQTVRVNRNGGVE